MRQWRRKIGLASISVGIALAIGCDRHSDATQTGAPAVTAPTFDAAATQTSDATQPAATQPASEMNIDDEIVTFPAARIRLHKKDGLLVTLFSNDPPEAINENYAGNSYYLELPFDNDDTAALGSASWRYKAPTTERADSPQGIFLNGGRTQLQPVDVAVDFKQNGDALTLSITGQFQMYATRESADHPDGGRTVIVSGTLTAVPEMK